MSKRLLVSDYEFGINKNGYDVLTCEKFKEEYLIRMSNLGNIECILLHLYYEENDRYEAYNFKNTIVHDPLHNPVSEIVCAIIFNILNENNKEYMEELLSKIKFISQNPHDKYIWGEKYFKNFNDCFLPLMPGNQVELNCKDNKQLKLNKNDNGKFHSDFIKETYKALENAFTYHE